MPISESYVLISEFLSANQKWLVEGSYSDLLELVTTKADEVIFLNVPISTCIANAKKRPWEPHKYQSKEAQDANLDMLIEWISNYTSRNDTFSKVAHEKLYDECQGKQTMYVSNERRT
jgi:adenylate kinase family enzyme